MAGDNLTRLAAQTADFDHDISRTSLRIINVLPSVPIQKFLFFRALDRMMLALGLVSFEWFYRWNPLSENSDYG